MLRSFLKRKARNRHILTYLTVGKYRRPFQWLRSSQRYFILKQKETQGLLGRSLNLCGWSCFDRKQPEVSWRPGAEIRCLLHSNKSAVLKIPLGVSDDTTAHCKRGWHYLDFIVYVKRYYRDSSSRWTIHEKWTR